MLARKSRYPGASQGHRRQTAGAGFSAISGNPSQLASLIDVVAGATDRRRELWQQVGAPSRTDGPAAVYAALQQDEINGVRGGVSQAPAGIGRRSMHFVLEYLASRPS